jgi:hypothetical protein
VGGEIKVGLFLTFSLGLFVALLFVYGRVTREWRGRRELHAVFNSVSGLRPEARVLYNGLEVGRVTHMDLVEMDAQMVDRLPPLNDSNMEVLPLTDEEREALRGLASDELDRAIRKCLIGRGVVLLTLEVLAEGDMKRYRQDDHVRVVATLMGESAVQIISGDGPPIAAGNPTILIGSSGDMYGALAKSMAQMKDIMNSIGEMIGGGGDTDSPVGQKVANFSKFTKRMDDMTDSLVQKMPKAWDRIDKELEKGRVKMSDLAKTVTDKRPGWEESLLETQNAIELLRVDVALGVEDGRAKVAAVRKDAGGMLKPLAKAVAENKGTIPNTIRDAREWTERIDGRVEAIGREMTHFDRKLTQGSESVRQTFKGMVGSVDGFEEKLWYLANYPWTFVRPPRGGQGQSLDLAWRKALMRRHYDELRNELEMAKREFKPGDSSDKVRLERIRQALRGLDAFLSVKPD